MDYLFAHVSSGGLVYGFLWIVLALFVLAVIIYLFDRSGGYF